MSYKVLRSIQDDKRIFGYVLQDEKGNTKDVLVENLIKYINTGMTVSGINLQTIYHNMGLCYVVVNRNDKLYKLKNTLTGKESIVAKQIILEKLKCNSIYVVGVSIRKSATGVCSLVYRDDSKLDIIKIADNDAVTNKTAKDSSNWIYSGESEGTEYIISVSHIRFKGKTECICYATVDATQFNSVEKMKFEYFRNENGYPSIFMSDGITEIDAVSTDYKKEFMLELSKFIQNNLLKDKNYVKFKEDAAKVYTKVK